jgi:hypothetical protein
MTLLSGIGSYKLLHVDKAKYYIQSLIYKFCWPVYCDKPLKEKYASYVAARSSWYVTYDFSYKVIHSQEAPH